MSLSSSRAVFRQALFLTWMNSNGSSSRGPPGRAATIRSAMVRTGRVSPKTTSPDANEVSRALREAAIASARLKRGNSIQQNREKARSEAMELCNAAVASLLQENMDVNGAATDAELSSSSTPLRIELRDVGIENSEPMCETFGDEYDGEYDDDDECNEQDLFITLLGRDAFDQLMIELEEILTSEDGEPGPGECEDPLGAGEEALLDWVDWDESSMIVCPLCKLQAMEIDTMLLQGRCQCSPPLRLDVVAQVAGSVSSLRETLEALLAAEYER